MDMFVHLWHILAMKVEWAQVSQELVRFLRGRTTQGGLSRRLGFKTNVIYRWEAGLREPTADDFLKLLHLRVDNIEATLWRFAQGPHSAGPSDSQFSWSDWLKAIRGDQSVAQIANRLEVSQQAVRRIFRGDSSPSLSRLLQLIDCMSNRVLDFVALVVDPVLIKSLKGVRALADAQLAISVEHLYAEAIIACLETKGYERLSRHSNEWIAGRLDLPLNVVETTMEALVAARGVRVKGGKFKTQDYRMVNIQSRSMKASRRLARHWTQVSIDLHEDRTRSGYLVFSADQETVDDVGRIMTEAMYQVIARIAKSKTVDQVNALTVNMARLDKLESLVEQSIC